MKYNINLNLNNREKMAVYAAAVFVAVFILVQLIIAPVFEKRNQLMYKRSTFRSAYVLPLTL